MSHLKRNLTIVFLCCVTLGICAVAFAQSVEEEEAGKAVLDKYTIELQEDIEAMMACGEDCLGLTIEPPSFEEMIKEMQESGMGKSEEQTSVSYEGDSTRGGICSATSSTITCTNDYSASYEYVAVGFPYHSTLLIVCTSTDGTNWTRVGWQTDTTQDHLYIYGSSNSESIGIVRSAQYLDTDCDFGDFPNAFSRQIMIAGMGGTDTVHGSQYGADTLYGEYVLGHEGDDVINLNYVSGITPGAWGGYGGDYIYGTNYADYVEGNADDDTMYGYDGNDIIVPGTGTDYCYGGNGSDTCTGCENPNSCS